MNMYRRQMQLWNMGPKPMHPSPMRTTITPPQSKFNHKHEARPPQRLTHGSAAIAYHARPHAYDTRGLYVRGNVRVRCGHQCTARYMHRRRCPAGDNLDWRGLPPWHTMRPVKPPPANSPPTLPLLTPSAGSRRPDHLLYVEKPTVSFLLSRVSTVAGSRRDCRGNTGRHDGHCCRWFQHGAIGLRRR